MGGGVGVTVEGNSPRPPQYLENDFRTALQIEWNFSVLYWHIGAPLFPHFAFLVYAF